MPERTRFAPSPTGMLHIGSLRTALYAYFLAKQTGGAFVLRIEDTDQARSVEGGIENIVETLHRAGIEPDEGFVLRNGEVEEVGEYGPYQQSNRLSIYRQYANRLLKDGNAYHCFCTKDRLDEVRKEQQKNKQQPKYDRHCLGLSDKEVEAKLAEGLPHVVRLKVPEGSSTVQDIIRGDVTFDHKEVDDQVLMKSDGFPTYHLAVVVDDHLMKISTIIRGEEWLPSTPKHIMLYNMLGFDLPKFAHVPLLLNPDKSKLSKRQGDVAAEQYLDKGYLPDALVNFIATLGYNPTGDREIYEVDELTKLFDISKVKKSGAVVNFEKLDWMNKQYMQTASTDDLVERLRAHRDELPDNINRIVDVEKGRATTLLELAESVDTYIELPSYEAGLLVWKKADARDALEKLEAAGKWLNENGPVSDVGALEQNMKEWIKDRDYMTGNVLWPLRIALSGQKTSPSPFELAYVLGEEEAQSRINKAIDLLKG